MLIFLPNLSNFVSLSWITWQPILPYHTKNKHVRKPLFCHIRYCLRLGHNFTKSKSPLIYEANSKVTTRSNPEKTAMKWTTELSPERISMIEEICWKSMEKFGYANYSNSQMTLADILQGRRKVWKSEGVSSTKRSFDEQYLLLIRS